MIGFNKKSGWEPFLEANCTRASLGVKYSTGENEP